MEKEELKSKLAAKIIANSERELYLQFKFLSITFGNLGFSEDESLSGIGTDGRNVFYNAGFIIDCYDKDLSVSCLILHTVIHLLLRHFAKNLSRRSINLWNAAADMAVWNIIDGTDIKSEAKNKSLRNAVYKEINKKTDIINADSCYEFISSLTNERFKKIADLFYSDNHGMWENNAENEKDPDEIPAALDVSLTAGEKDFSDEELSKLWENLAAKTLTDAEMFNHANDNFEPFIDALRVNLAKRYDYGKFLRKFLSEREVIKSGEDFDYIYYTYGLTHYKNMPLIENLEYREENLLSDVYIAVDTSGSTKGELVKKFLEQTYSLVSSVSGNVKKFRIYILQCDDKVREFKEISSYDEFQKLMNDFVIIGGGGTDFTKVFEFIEERRKQTHEKIKGLLYFTDGNGLFPKTAPDYDTAFIFYDDYRNNYNVPPWCVKLVLSKEDLK